MNLYTLKNKKGFTIIEVVLVLAVAGLIFLMVFLALPALQRSQRDMQRKQDLLIVKEAVEQWMMDHRVNITHNDKNLMKIRDDLILDTKYDKKKSKYFQKELVTPNGGEYHFSVARMVNLNPTTTCSNGKTCFDESFSKKYTGGILEFININFGTKCAEDGKIEIVGLQDRPYTITLALENAGIACLDS
jgi:prepilin-type N-terminal cleavage/methylation domain